jgi:hypothetical protein
MDRFFFPADYSKGAWFSCSPGTQRPPLQNTDPHAPELRRRRFKRHSPHRPLFLWLSLGYGRLPSTVSTSSHWLAPRYHRETEYRLYFRCSKLVPPPHSSRQNVSFSLLLVHFTQDRQHRHFEPEGTYLYISIFTVSIVTDAILGSL